MASSLSAEQIRHLFHAVVDLDIAARAAYLDRVCRDIPGLREEVEALLAASAETDDVLAPYEDVVLDPQPAIDAPPLSPRSQGLVGHTVSHYRIEEKLGGGGMGVVYQARDTTLDRPVALKFLPPHLSMHDEAQQRFIHEAKAASALDHVNICTIYEAGEHAGQLFIAMAYYEGETLKKKIARGALAVEEALDYAIQMTEGLARAHEAEIVHRDVKPANVMVTDRGRVKIVDFGLAKVAEQTQLTRTGMTLGTVAYMSPEQARGEPVDARTDIWSLGAVLYEMLAGARPFRGDYEQAVIYAVLNMDPEPLRALRPKVPEAVARLVHRALEKNREARPASMTELLDALKAIQASMRPAQAASLQPKTLLRQPRVVIPAMILLLALGGVAVWWYSHTARVRWARQEALPEVARLTGQQQWAEAFRLVRQAERYIPDDPQLQALKHNTALPVAIYTTPAGAEVYVKGYRDIDGAWEHLGTSPLDSTRVPAGHLRWRVVKDGFQPVEGAFDVWLADSLHFTLEPTDSHPPGMVYVPGGPYQLDDTNVTLASYWMDTYEVTNEAFNAFVEGGGYRERSYWNHAFQQDGQALLWEDAIAMFRDATGRQGPATWEVGSYPEGQADYPVGGVNWYEAAAYCEFADKQLPTVYHWSKAAGHGIYSDILSLSNIGTEGPAPVGRYHGLSPYGNYDMAGNVKEWCSNQIGSRRYIAGGAWNEPDYLFGVEDAQSPFDRSASHGFRCARYPDSLSEALTAPVDLLVHVTPALQPVSDEVFQVYERLYAYDRAALNAVVESVDESTEHWRKEIVTFDAAYGDERVIAYLFLPRNAPPPYQTVIYFPGGMATRLPSIETSAEMAFVEFLPKSGRALLFPVYQGTYERRPATRRRGPHALRELIIQWSKDLGRSIDYLETRPDIDAERLAFYGLSYGAVLGPVFTTVEDRIEASVLLSGGLWPFPQECDPVHFAPRSATPTLMLAGRNDFMRPVEGNQRLLFDLLATPDEDKHLAVFEGGHTPYVWNDAVREILDWLDRYLGPVL